MKISARNQLKGRITKIVHGPVAAEVTLQVAGGAEIVSIITDSSARDLGSTDQVSRARPGDLGRRDGVTLSNVPTQPTPDASIGPNRPVPL